MIWLLVQMWIYLAVAFVLGMAAYRWVFGGPGLSAEDVSAELASIRTRHQEAEAERARLRSRVHELTNELEDAQRQARSAAALARTSGKETGDPSPAAEPPTPAPEPQQAAPEPPAAEAAPPPAPRREPIVERAPPEPDPEPAPSPAVPEASAAAATLGADTAPFLSAADKGPPDDLTRIRGVGAKLQRTLNELGVYYYWQIAGWTDEQAAEVDAHLSFPGRITRERWRDQAKKLMEALEG